MKSFPKLSAVTLPILGASSLFVVSCSSVSNTYKNALDKIKQPISDNGYNPLDKPGVRSSRSTLDSNLTTQSQVNSNDHGFNNGDIVEVVIPNTALFAKVPKAGDRYKKVLNVGDSLRVVGGEKDFIKVVTESGETGYVSSVMVVTQGFLTQAAPDSIQEVNSYSAPIVPDIAPEPEVKGIGEPDEIPSVAPAEVPSISAPVPIPVAPEVPEIPDPGLSIPGVPSVDLPAPEPIVPSVPDLDPIIPSIPDVAPEPSNPGLPQ